MTAVVDKLRVDRLACAHLKDEVSAEKLLAHFIADRKQSQKCMICCAVAADDMAHFAAAFEGHLRDVLYPVSRIQLSCNARAYSILTD